MPIQKLNIRPYLEKEYIDVVKVSQMRSSWVRVGPKLINMYPGETEKEKMQERCSRGFVKMKAETVVIPCKSRNVKDF